MLKPTSFDPFAPTTATDAEPTTYDLERQGMCVTSDVPGESTEGREVRVIKPSIEWRYAGKWETGPDEVQKEPEPASADIARFPKSVVKPGRSLADLYPDVAAQWHPTKNGEVGAGDVMPKTNNRAWWLCPKCGCEWQTKVSTRTAGSGCPHCGTAWRRLPIACVETDEEFDSIRAAAAWCGLKSNTSLRAALKNPNKTAGGYHWRHAGEPKDKV